MTSGRVKYGLDVCDAPIALEAQRWNVTRGATDSRKNLAPACRGRRLLTGSRLEVVQEVELQIIDECGPLVDCADVTLVRRRLLDRIETAIEHHSGRGGDRPRSRRHQIGIVG